MPSVQIDFYGLCFFDQATSEHEVRVLLPDTRQKTEHIDGTPARVHRPRLCLPAEVVDPYRSEIGGSYEGKDGNDYWVVDLRDAEVKLEPTLRAPPLRPGGNRVELDSFPDFGDFTTFGVKGTPPTAARLELEVGTLLSHRWTPVNPGWDWHILHQDEPDPAKPACRFQKIAYVIRWGAAIQGIEDQRLLTIEVGRRTHRIYASRAQSEGPFSITLGNVDTGVIPFGMADVTRCRQPQCKDRDFKWYYELLEGGMLDEPWPTDAELVVPTLEAKAFKRDGVDTPTCFPSGC